MELIYAKAIQKKDIPKKISTFLKHYLVVHEVPPTYDSKSKRTQCMGGKHCRRSFTDLWLLVNFYYPKTTMRRMAQALKFVVLKYDLEIHFCHATKKVVIANRSKNPQILDNDHYNIRTPDNNKTGYKCYPMDLTGVDGVSKQMILDWIEKKKDAIKAPTHAQVIAADDFWQKK